MQSRSKMRVSKCVCKQMKIRENLAFVLGMMKEYGLTQTLTVDNQQLCLFIWVKVTDQ